MVRRFRHVKPSGIEPLKIAAQLWERTRSPQLPDSETPPGLAASVLGPGVGSTAEAGFIGGERLCRALNQEGFEVRSVDINAGTGILDTDRDALALQMGLIRVWRPLISDTCC